MPGMKKVEVKTQSIIVAEKALIELIIKKVNVLSKAAGFGDQGFKTD